MGNYRFRLSDMIPNSWFYKLKYMRRHKATKKKQASSSPSSSSRLSHSSMAEPNHSSRIPKQPHLSDQRKSYHFTRDLAFHPNSPSATRFSDKHSPVEPPRKSSRRRRSTRRYRPPSRLVSAGCSCRATVGSVWTDRSNSPPEECPNSPLRDDQASSSERDSVLPECGSERVQTTDGTLSSSTCCECKAKNDVVIEMDDDKLLDGEFDGTSELDRLPPIITRKDVPTKIQRTSAEFSERNTYGSLKVKVLKEDFSSSGACHGKDERKAAASLARRLSANSSSPGLKLRTNSPRMVKRRIQAGRKSGSSNSSSGSRRSVSESFAVVKSSKDPRRDFRESMVEMIVENNIRASKDLEELLACYLSLNSDEYHDLIINVFKQIWFDFVIHLRLK